MSGENEFDLASCKAASESGDLDGWIDRYLGAGPWANEGLRSGLKLRRRYWLGPIFVPLDALERCCGPETTMEYRVPPEVWAAKVARIARSLAEPEDLPPLIVERRPHALTIRDGSHRAAAMARMGWPGCYAVVWCNTRADHESALKRA